MRGEFGTGDALAVKLWTCVSVKNTQAMARSNFKSVSFDEMIVFIDMKKTSTKLAKHYEERSASSSKRGPHHNPHTLTSF